MERKARWCLDRFVDDEVKAKYRDALRAKVNGFSKSIKHRVESGMNGSNLVNEVYVVEQPDGGTMGLDRRLSIGDRSTE